MKSDGVHRRFELMVICGEGGVSLLCGDFFLRCRQGAGGAEKNLMFEKGRQILVTVLACLVFSCGAGELGISKRESQMYRRILSGFIVVVE